MRTLRHSNHGQAGFRVVVLRRNGTENRVKQVAHFVPNRCRSIPPVWAYTLAYDFFRFVSWPQLSSFEGMGKNRRIELRKNCRTSLCGNNPHVPHVRAHVQPIRAEKRQPRAGIVAQTCAAHVHRLAREKMHVQETCAARNKRNRKQKGTPDSKPVGRWQNSLRHILDTLGQASLLRVRPEAFLFDLARLYTQAQRLDQPPPSTARGSTPKPQKIPPVGT